MTPAWLRDLLLRVFGGRAKADLDYWHQRVARFGRRSVLNLRHTEEELAEVTRRQIEFVFPILRRHLRGDERVVLDYGCGSGRFTAPLAELIGGQAIGVDPIQELLDLAPASPSVTYRVLGPDSRIPVDDRSVDVVWSCLVLGAITDEAALRDAAAEITRVLPPGGLLFLVENTADKPSVRHYRFRPIQAYVALFPGIALSHEDDYFDVGERISVLAGRKQ